LRKEKDKEMKMISDNNYVYKMFFQKKKKLCL
jgi:hypothetical protein